MKRVFIAEKPSVARDFAAALHENFLTQDGFMESEQSVVTWCFGHLVTMSYPDAYDPKYKRWSLDTIPFIPETYRYEVIGEGRTKKQFQIVKKLLTSKEVDTIYICTDSGREGEYIYRLVASQAGVKGKRQLRVWIDSFTEAEILRGIREAKEDACYDGMGAAAYLRAQEDYLMGINFSRALSLKYAGGIRDFLGMEKCVIAVGRVMTCVLGIIVRREREIRSFVKTPFYRVAGTFSRPGEEGEGFEAEWSAVKGSRYFESPLLYKENGFRERKDAQALIDTLMENPEAKVKSVSRRTERRSAPLLYNLAELQNDCSRYYKLSPDQTLTAAQTLYERKLTTYPRTDARVLSSAVAAEIDHNLKGVGRLPEYRELVRPIAESGSWKKIGKTKYTNDKAITDHYAIIPTGEGLKALSSLSPEYRKIYDLIVRRFLAVFYPAAVFDKMAVQVEMHREVFTASLRVNREKGYLVCLERPGKGGRTDSGAGGEGTDEGADASGRSREQAKALEAFLKSLKKGDVLHCDNMVIREGETTPPRRYTGGSMILTMENAGQFIEDEELREQIRGSGIGTSATRAAILEKLVDNQYLSLNAKTQVYTPTQLGEMIYDCVDVSIRPLLDPRLTASWEKGLTQVAEGTATQEEYRRKLNDYVARRTNAVKESNHSEVLQQMYRRDAQYYPKPMRFGAKYTFSGTSVPGRKSTGSRKTSGRGTSGRGTSSRKSGGKAQKADSKPSGTDGKAAGSGQESQTTGADGV